MCIYIYKQYTRIVIGTLDSKPQEVSARLVFFTCLEAVLELLAIEILDPIVIGFGGV